MRVGAGSCKDVCVCERLAQARMSSSTCTPQYCSRWWFYPQDWVLSTPSPLSPVPVFRTPQTLVSSWPPGQGPAPCSAAASHTVSRAHFPSFVGHLDLHLRQEGGRDPEVCHWTILRPDRPSVCKTQSAESCDSGDCSTKFSHTITLRLADDLPLCRVSNTTAISIRNFQRETSTSSFRPRPPLLPLSSPPSSPTLPYTSPTPPKTPPTRIYAR